MSHESHGNLRESIGNVWFLKGKPLMDSLSLGEFGLKKGLVGIISPREKENELTALFWRESHVLKFHLIES